MLPGTASSDAVEQGGTGQPYPDADDCIIHGTTEYRAVDMENWECVKRRGRNLCEGRHVRSSVQ